MGRQLQRAALERQRVVQARPNISTSSRLNAFADAGCAAAITATPPSAISANNRVILDIACVLHAQIAYTRIHVKPVSGSLGHRVLSSATSHRGLIEEKNELRAPI